MHAIVSTGVALLIVLMLLLQGMMFVFQHSKSEMFNKFLKEMKSDFIGTRYSAFWSKVVGESVSLITSGESGDSAVTQEEAKQVMKWYMYKAMAGH